MNRSLPGDWSGLIVVVGAVHWDGSRLLDQHLAEGLARYAPVLYVDPPRPWYPKFVGARARANAGARVPVVSPPTVELLGPNLALARPSTFPAHQRPGVKAISIELVRRAMKQAVHSLGDPSVRAVIVNSLDRCFGAVGEQTKVFYASDDFVAGAELMRISAVRLRRETVRQRRDADLHVAASPALAADLRAEGYEPLLIPNGCDYDTFAATDSPAVAPAAEVTLTGPVAGFMGHVTGRIDPEYVAAVADRGHPVLLVGPAPGGLSPELAALCARENVQWAGAQPFDALPSYLKHVGVGIIPYADTPFNHASFPLKALEYLAAGRPVVSSDIDGLRWLLDSAEGAITGDDLVLTRSPQEFAEATERLLHLEAAAAAETTANKAEVPGAGGSVKAEVPEAGGSVPVAVARRKKFARRHSWESRFAPLAAALDLPVDTVSEVRK